MASSGGPEGLPVYDAQPVWRPEPADGFPAADEPEGLPQERYRHSPVARAVAATLLLAFVAAAILGGVMAVQH